jgi:GAF domain-containing protein
MSDHLPVEGDQSEPAGGTRLGDGSDADLQTSFADLAGVVAQRMGLDELLSHVAAFGAHAIPGADGAGVTLLLMDGTEPRVEALAASAPFVAEVDDIQYAVLNEGPCITAVHERRTVRSGSLAGEMRWPRFGPRVASLGVHSALSLPLLVPGHLVGALNVYAYDEDVFDERAAHLGELFARPAAVAVYNAQILAQALTLTHQLQRVLSTRPVIDQAIGLLRGRLGIGAEEAFGRLRTLSQNENTKLADVAQQIVDQAVRRARARHGSD